MSGRPQGGYASLTTDDQVAFLKEVAREGAAQFGLDVADIGLVLHSFNTTFRVDTVSGDRAALRVNTNSFSTPENIRAQTAWMRALATDTEIRLPVPLRTAAGDDVATVECEGAAHVVTAASWLEGDDVGECDPLQARALGRVMALLHEHASGWTVPPEGHLSGFVDPLFGDEDRLTTAYQDRPGDLALVEWAFERCSSALTAAASGEPAIVIHGDLHGGNLKWHEGELSVFDFDDCGIGCPTLDLAISTFYLRSTDPAVESALRDGYAEIRELPDPPDLEGVVASRQLLLANDLLRSRTSELRDLALPYLDRTVERLARWRETGRFTLSA